MLTVKTQLSICATEYYSLQTHRKWFSSEFKVFVFNFPWKIVMPNVEEGEFPHGLVRLLDKPNR